MTSISSRINRLVLLSPEAEQDVLSIWKSYHWAGIYARRMLKGEKPADLPVQQSTTVELIVNLKAAKALGIAVPLPLLGRADKIVE